MGGFRDDEVLRMTLALTGANEEHSTETPKEEKVVAAHYSLEGRRASARRVWARLK